MTQELFKGLFILWLMLAVSSLTLLPMMLRTFTMTFDVVGAVARRRRAGLPTLEQREVLKLIASDVAAVLAMLMWFLLPPYLAHHFQLSL